ncbi:MAG: N-acetylneuraminate synthase family protein [Candidatus Omnitrophica bacterium]|nr:N-acetylneuraminate synthase family protein [Candidatus Omnitrophota bacterium]
MKIGDFDLEKDILIVAEIGNNHEGDYMLAEKMIRLAVKAGAGAVKLQTYRTELYVNRKDKARFDKLKSFELTYDEFYRLSKVAQSEGVLFLSTPFDLESAEFLNTIVPAFKISSGDNTFYPLLEKVAQFGKPVILSSGLADLKQIRCSKSFIERIWEKVGRQQSLAVLHCVASYPVSPAEVNLMAISQLKYELQCTVGYSDHSLGIEAAVLSVVLGARIVEKHFTVDRNYSDFKDHQLSADPQNMSELVRRIKEITVLLGTGEINVQESEKSVSHLLRRSIAAKRDLPKGAKITWDDITWVRPAGGISPGEEHRFIGNSLSRSVKAGEQIIPEFLKEKKE